MSERKEIMKQALYSPDVKKNLMVMTAICGAASFNFLLLIFLVNTFDQVYMTALMISIADMLAYISSGIIVE